jgi:hypothetical protein
VTNAVIIIINNGITDILVRKPARTKVPQTTSKLAVKYAQNAGSLNPICPNLPVPNNSYQPDY